MGTTSAIYKNSHHLDKDDERIKEFNDEYKKIVNDKTPSTIDNLKKHYFYSKKLKKLKKSDSGFDFMIAKKILLGNLYTLNYLIATDSMKEDYFERKKDGQIVKTSWSDEKSSVSITAIDKEKIITSKITKSFFTKRMKYRISIITKAPSTYWTLNSSLAKINLKNNVKHQTAGIVKRINKTIKYINKQKLDREEILKLDFNNINYGK